MTTDELMITAPTFAEIGTALPPLSDFAVMTGAKVLDAAQGNVGSIWTRDDGTSQSSKTAATLGKKGVVKQNLTQTATAVGVAPSWQNPGAAGFDVAETKHNGLCLTYRGRLVYWPQREATDELTKKLDNALFRAKYSRLYAATEMRKVGKYTTPWLGDNMLLRHSDCYIFEGQCYVHYLDRFNMGHWFHNEPLCVVANPEQNTLRAATALFATCYHDPSNMWGPKQDGISGLDWFLNHDFLQNLSNSVKYGKYINERAVKRRYCLFEPRGLKQFARNALYTMDDYSSTNEGTALQF